MMRRMSPCTYLLSLNGQSKMSEKTLIDPFSFFIAGGPKIVEPPPPAVKRPLIDSDITRSASSTAVSSSAATPAMKRAKVDPVVCSRMPGVNAVTTTQAPHGVAELWVEKFKPRALKDLVGNNVAVNKLASWLRAYNHKTATQSVRPGQDNTTAKAALISGPPGIGKTSTARLVCESLGYSVIEFNASDTRSKSAIDELASGLSTNTVLFGNNGKAGLGAQVAIIMDEVDGMAGSGDRGGGGALIQLIKRAKLPVICVCNDRQDSKVRSLANHCFDLRFLRPSTQEIAVRASMICRMENLVMTPNELAEIAESSGCDMRQVINHLQLIKTSGKSQAGKGQKDETMGPFEVVKGLFTSTTAKTWDYAKRNELFFLDYDLTPLLVQQNYLRCVDKITDPRVLPAMRKANEFITLGDVIGRAIHQDSQWALLPEYGTMSTVAPAFACNNALAYPDFPAWLGKQSTFGKNSRLFKELRTMTGTLTTCTARNVKLSGYADVLYETLVGQLGNPDGIKATIHMLDELGVTKDSLFEVLSETRFNWQTDPYAKIDSKTKSALTRTYNSGNHVLRAGGAENVKAAKKGAVTTAHAKQRNDFGDEDDFEDPPEVEDDQPASALVKPAKATAKKRN